MAKNEAFILSQTLPRMLDKFDGVICAYTSGEDETGKILAENGVKVLPYEWTHDWADARNAVIKTAEMLEFNWMLMLDADEAMLRDDLDSFRKLAEGESYNGFAFPRYEFVDDFQHWSPVFYPDLQARAFPLNQGFHYRGKMHEQLCFKDYDCTAWQAKRLHRAPQHIFHYGKSKPVAEVAFKYLNYDRAYQKLPLLDRLPDGYALPESFASGEKKRFEGEKPI